MATLEELSEEVGAVIVPRSDMENPELWERYGREWVRFDAPRSFADVYDLISFRADSFRMNRRVGVNVETPSAVALAVTGWAAPIDPNSGEPSEVRPSLHAERLRVFVVPFVECDSTGGTRLTMYGYGEDGEPVTTTEPLGVGSLAERLDQLGAVLWGGDYLAGLLDCWTAVRDEVPPHMVEGFARRVAVVSREVGEGVAE